MNKISDFLKSYDYRKFVEYINRLSSLIIMSDNLKRKYDEKYRDFNNQNIVYQFLDLRKYDKSTDEIKYCEYFYVFDFKIDGQYLLLKDKEHSYDLKIDLTKMSIRGDINWNYSKFYSEAYYYFSLDCKSDIINIVIPYKSTNSIDGDKAKKKIKEMYSFFKNIIEYCEKNDLDKLVIKKSNSNNSSSKADELLKLKKLLDSDAITKEEYEKLKNEII